MNFPYNLKQQEEGLNVLEEVFVTISSVQESDGIRDVYKLLKKKDFFKHWKKEGKRIDVEFYAELALQRLLEIMGYLSILHTEKYRGSFFMSLMRDVLQAVAEVLIGITQWIFERQKWH